MPRSPRRPPVLAVRDGRPARASRPLGFRLRLDAARAAVGRAPAGIERAPVAMLVAAGGTVSRANREAHRLLGHAPGALAGVPLNALLPVVQGASDAVTDVQARRADGERLWVQVAVRHLGGDRRQIVLVDVSTRHRAEEELRRGAAQQRALAGFGQRALEGAEVRELMRLACELVVEHLRVDVGKVLELDRTRGVLVLRAAIGIDPALIGVATSDVRDTQPGAALATEEPVVVEDLLDHPNLDGRGIARSLGVRSNVEVLIGSRADPLGTLGASTFLRRRFSQEEQHFLQGLGNVLGDAIARERAAGAMRHQALHDPLTGLPNRVLLLERLRHWLEGADRRTRQGAIVLLDLDHFKVVNDSLGHHVGDELLRAVGPRLRAAVRPGDTVARLGGDEFAIFCEDVGDDADVDAVTRRVLGALEGPIALPGHCEQRVSASVGVARTGSPPLAADDVMRNADAAMYQAKQHGRGRVERFSAALLERSRRRLRVERELRTALDEEGQLQARFQPIVALDTGAPTGFETLARWLHPRDGMIAPDEFIPVAEEAGLIGHVGERMLGLAADAIAGWHRSGHPELCASVNLSVREVGDPRTVAAVQRVLDATGLAAGRLCLEVTETALLGDLAAARRTFERLRDLGARIMLDDFGTGFSSLSHVKTLPIDALKIDRSFVAEATASRSSRAIIAAVVQLAAGIDAEVVAEGVETAEQHDCVRELGCGFGQGYLYARPMTAAEATILLAERVRAA